MRRSSFGVFWAHRNSFDNESRWAIWLVGASPDEVNRLPAIRERVEAVSNFRLASKAATTRAYRFPTLFRQVTQPATDYVLVPGHTSENRLYVPFGFVAANVIVGNSCFSIAGAGRYHFGIIQSTMHMAWVRYTCGRLESRYRYSKDIVYNNYPWPDKPDRRAEGKNRSCRSGRARCARCTSQRLAGRPL